MRSLKIGNRLLIVGYVLYVLQNVYFGWNKYPQSYLEHYIDIINTIILYVGWGIYLLPVFSLYERAVKKSKRELISNKYTLRAKYMLETGNYLKSEEDVDKNYLSNYVKWLEEKTLKEN